MVNNWNLSELRQKGVKYESAVAGEEKISRCEVNKLLILIKELETKKQNSPQKMLQMRFAIQYQKQKRVQCLKSKM